MCDTARQQAYDLCVDHARQLGANAVVAVRYDISSFNIDDTPETEVACYGTAVVVEGENKVASNSNLVISAGH